MTQHEDREAHEAKADELDFGRDIGDAVVAEDGPPSEDDEDEKDG